MAILGSAYITAAQFKSLEANGLDLSAWTDPQLDELLAAASRLIDSYVNDTFGLIRYNDERLVWNMVSHRVYPIHHPIKFAIELRLYFTEASQAIFDATTLFVSREDYVALTSFALLPQISIIPALIGTGLKQVVAGLTYIAGTGDLVASGATLAETIEADETGWDVSSGASFAVGDLIEVGTAPQERALVDTIAGNTLTVVRSNPTRVHATGLAISKFQSAAPKEVATATWLTAAHMIGQQGLKAEGLTGLRQAVIGSYSISVGGDSSSGGLPFVPDAAKAVLQKYRKIRLQGA